MTAIALTRPQARVHAQRMRGSWTTMEIRDYLAARGVNVSKATVHRWANPNIEEAHRLTNRARQRRRYRATRPVTTRLLMGDSDGLLARIVALDEAGITAPMIAKVIKLDYGIAASRYQIARSLVDARLTPSLAKRARE